MRTLPITSWDTGPFVLSLAKSYCRIRLWVGSSFHPSRIYLLSKPPPGKCKKERDDLVLGATVPFQNRYSKSPSGVQVQFSLLTSTTSAEFESSSGSVHFIHVFQVSSKTWSSCQNGCKDSSDWKMDLQGGKLCKMVSICHKCCTHYFIFDSLWCTPDANMILNFNYNWKIENNFKQEQREFFPCHNMDASWKQCAKWNKPVFKDKYCIILLMWWS